VEGYGSALSLCRIDRLTPTEYRQSLETVLRPGGPWASVERHGNWLYLTVPARVKSSSIQNSPSITSMPPPAQDATGGYGSALSLCRIDRLTPTEYRQSLETVLRALSHCACKSKIEFHSKQPVDHLDAAAAVEGVEAGRSTAGAGTSGARPRTLPAATAPPCRCAGSTASPRIQNSPSITSMPPPRLRVWRPAVAHGPPGRSTVSSYRRGGHLWRPAQDATGGYGSALSLCRIDRLTPTE
jgi:hypothetical protein